MSWVANLIVQADEADAGVVQRLDEWLQTAPRRDGTFGPRGVGSLRSLTNPLDHTWGGWKHPECTLWAGALNHADLESLLDCIRSLPWRYRGALQVFLMDQEESYFRLYMFRDDRLQQCTAATARRRRPARVVARLDTPGSVRGSTVVARGSHDLCVPKTGRPTLGGRVRTRTPGRLGQRTDPNDCGRN